MTRPAMVSDLIEILESLAPVRLAAKWDNVGLQVGDCGWKVRQVHIALDPLPSVVATACSQGADALITHHPLIFQALQRVDFDTPVGAVIKDAAAHKLSVISVHTNLDSARDGLNDLLARRLGLERCSVLVPAPIECGHGDGQTGVGEGFGRVGQLQRPSNLKQLIPMVKERMQVASLRVVGTPDMAVDRVAICSGSGGGLLQAFLESDAQVYITGDLKYHDARTIESAGRGALDIGHFASEHIVVPWLARRLTSVMAQQDFAVEVNACLLENDPFIVY